MFFARNKSISDKTYCSRSSLRLPLATPSKKNFFSLLTACALSVLVGFSSNTYADGGINYSITYDDGVVSNMPTDLSSTSVGSSVTLSSNVPAWNKHNFLGWCSGTITNSDGIDSCSGTTYAAGSNYTLSGTSSNALSLTAMWQVVTQSSCPASPMISTVASGITYMQDITSSNRATVLASLTTNATYQIKDNRDNETYCVGKLADGKLWMLDNLALDLTDSNILNSLSSSNTNASTGLPYLKGISTGTTSDQYATAKVTDWTSSNNSYSAPLVNMTYKDVIPTEATSTAGGYKIGGYYNYCAASAGSYCYGNDTSYGTSSGNATEDICPAGWRMPTGNTSGEFQALYSNSDYNTNTNYRSALHLPFSGNFSYGSRNNQGSSGYWWSSTRRSNLGMYYLSADYSAIYQAGYGNRGYGYSLRCVAGS